MRTAALGLAILIMVPNLAPGQQSSDPPPGRAVIEGTVINARNGRMVPWATVVLRNAKRPADAKSTRADGTGHFIFKDVDPGAYGLSADRQGYFLDVRKGSSALRVEVSAGEERKDLLLRLTPTAVVTGQIMDENADPMQHVQVKLLSRAYRGRRMVLGVAGIGLTDDRGEYRIYDVQPGHYYILAQATASIRAKGLQVIAATGIVGVIQVASGAEPDPEPDFTYAPLFYPGTSDFLQAQSLPVHPGEELHSDFVMMARPSVAVQGKVVNGITGAPANHPGVTVSWSEHWDSGIDAKVSPDATFEAGGLAPGAYTLRTSFTEDGLTYTGQQILEVGPLGIRNVLLVGLPDSEIAGAVRVEGSEQERSAVKRIAVEFLGKDTPKRSTASATLPTLQFKTAVHPGDGYTVAAYNLPLDYYLKSVNLSGHEVQKNDVVVSDRRGAIELILSPAGGHLEGVVVDDNSQPVAVTVVLVPEEAAKRDDRNLFRRSSASSKGKFTLRGIAPGTYKLLALDDVDFEEMVTRPEILKPYEDRGELVTVNERGNYNVLLRIIRMAEQQ